MTFLDAYALIALLAGGDAERQVRAILDAGDAGIATANLIEVFDVAVRVVGIPSVEAARVIDPLLGAVLTVVPLDLPAARLAARIRVEHYHPRRRPLSLADCVLLASGDEGDRVATADRHVLEVAPLVGREPVALPGG